MNVSVIGTGYVGLVSGVCLADKGHQVICVDLDQAKVDRINAGDPPIYERDLEELLKKNIGSSLTATTDLRTAVLNSDLSLIAVGTPFDGDEIDLTFIKTVARQIGEVLRDKESYHAVIVKSTVVPGTTDSVVLPILEESSGKRVGEALGVGMNPEFLREGEAIADFMNPDRIVLGGIDQRTIDVLAELYSIFPDVDKLPTNPRTAEMIKYTANSLLATMISFSNEIGNLSAELGEIDIVDVMRGVHLDKRLSPIMPNGERVVPSFTTYLEAGCGFGGSCFPKDVKALIAYGRKVGLPMTLLDSVIQVNAEQPQQVLSILNKHFASIDNLSVAVLGLAFKPGTDDMRESPAIPIVQSLLKQNAQVKAYDPIASHEAKKIFGSGQIVYCEQLDETVQDVEAVLLLTSWNEFSVLPALLENQQPQPLVIDGRRMLCKESVARYDGIGM